MAYNDVVLNDSPVLYFRLEETSGTSATNSGSAGGTGTIGAGTTKNVTGIPGGGKAFTMSGGTTAYVSYALSPTYFADKVFSVEWWQKGGANSQDVGEYYGSGSGYGVIVDGTGKLKFTIYGGTTNAPLTSTTTVTGSTWHHIVFTANGNDFKLYVDGTLEASSTTNIGTFSPSATFYTGSYQASSFTGTLDEVAVYDSALSSTIISAHRYAGNTTPSNGGHTATAATSSATMPGGYKQEDKSVSVSVATGSGAMGDAKRAKSTSVTASIDKDTNVSDNTQGDGLFVGSTSDYRAFIDFVLPALPSDATVVKVVLRLNQIGDLNSNVPVVGRATASWSEADHTAPTQDYTSQVSVPFTSTGRGYVNVDVTALYNLGLTNGFAIKSTATAGRSFPTGIASSEYSGNEPTLLIDYVSEGATSVSVTPATGSGEAEAVTVSAGTGVTQTHTVATGSGALVVPGITVESHPDAIVVVDPMTGSGAGPLGGFAVPTTVSVTHAAGSGEMEAVSVATDRNAIVRPSALTGNGELASPSEAQHASDDPYYQLIRATTNADDAWYRLDETSGFIAHASLGGSGDPNDSLNAVVNGDYAWNVIGPESRKALHLTNGYIVKDIDSDLFEFTFEAVIRTSTPDGMLAFGLDTDNTFGNPFRNSIYLKGGKVALKFTSGATGQPQEIVGLKNVADGQWHHIAVSWGRGNLLTLDNGLRIVVDGKLDLRREYSNLIGTNLIATPDSYFGMPDAWRTGGFGYAPNFVGDVMEVVFRTGDDLTTDGLKELFYAAFGIKPVRVAAATATGEMLEAKGKGNQKRALMLYYEYLSGSNAYGQASVYSGEEKYSSGVFEYPGDYDFGPNIRTPHDISFNDKLEVMGYKVFYAPVMGEMRQPGASGPYRDYVTDEPRLINVQEDVNVDDFDLIFFRNWPDEGEEIDKLLRIGYTVSDLEDVLASVRQAQDETGISLWITNPAMANQYGLISRVEYISTLFEVANTNFQGNAAGDYDPRGADVDLWLNKSNPNQDLAGGRPDSAKYFYRDVHRNNRQRVVATVDGLTTIPGEVLVDAFIRDERDNMDVGGKLATKFENRQDGLVIGDEMIDSSMLYNDLDESFSRPGYGQYKTNAYGIPAGAVTAGTAVTKFSAKVWQGRTQIDNPYAEYVGTVVVEPGDSVKGRPIGGKVFFNISENPTNAFWQFQWLRQIVPPNEQIRDPRDWEDAAQREWDYSPYRVIYGGSGGNSGSDSNVLVQNPDGSFTFKAKGNASMVNISEKYATETLQSLTWTNRGLLWLADREVVEAGDKVVRVSAANASAALVQPSTVAQKSVSVNVQAAVANGTIVNPDEVADPDAQVLVLPATGSALITGYGKVIGVAPFNGSALMTEIGTTAGGDAANVYILRPAEITLFIKEDA